MATDQELQTRYLIPSTWEEEKGLECVGKSLLIERRCGKWALLSKDFHILILFNHWVYQTSAWSTRGVAFSLGEEPSLYQGSPPTSVRPLSSFEGLLGSSSFCLESSGMGQSRALFKCISMPVVPKTTEFPFKIISSHV